MHVNEFKKAFSAAMDDEAFRAIFQEKIKGVVNAAVTEAVAESDAEISDLREELFEAKVKLNELEQYSRRLCLNESGIPENEDESTDQLVTDIARMVGVTIAPATSTGLTASERRRTASIAQSSHAWRTSANVRNCTTPERSCALQSHSQAPA